MQGRFCLILEYNMKLNDFFAAHPKVAIAFSGGADSAYLLYAAKQYNAEAQYALGAKLNTGCESSG